MAEKASISITYTPTAESTSNHSLRITLEPEYSSEKENNADLADIDAMLAMAMSGISSVNRLIDRCPWAKWGENGTLTVTLGLYVWPSDIDLIYELLLPVNVTSAPPTPVREVRSKKYWVDGGGNIELPWLLENANCTWNQAVGCADEWSVPVTPPPAVKYEQAQITVDVDGIYGVLDVSGVAVGWRHELTVTYQKIAEGGEEGEETPKINSIEAEDITVAAIWTDESEEEQQREEADMTIPPCVVELLATCDDGRIKTYVDLKKSKEKFVWNIYYSGCDGTMLGRRLVQSEGDADDE